MKFLRIISITAIIALILFICANTALIFIRKDYTWFMGVGIDFITLIPIYMFSKLFNVSKEGKENQFKDEIEGIFKKMDKYREDQYK